MSAPGRQYVGYRLFAAIVVCRDYATALVMKSITMARLNASGDTMVVYGDYATTFNRRERDG